MPSSSIVCGPTCMPTSARDTSWPGVVCQRGDAAAARGRLTPAPAAANIAASSWMNARRSFDETTQVASYPVPSGPQRPAIVN